MKAMFINLPFIINERETVSFLNFIVVYLIYNIVFVSYVEQSDSLIHIYNRSSSASFLMLVITEY